MLSIIKNRRSIRRYSDTPVPGEMVEEVLQAGIAAPSSKNRQPWHFVVVSGKAKAEMLDVMAQGLVREKEQPLLPQSARYINGAKHTLKIMTQAPVTIFVINQLGLPFKDAIGAEERIYEVCNAQSIGAALENMTLAATELGLGSLWICDTFFAQAELNTWLHSDGELFAAMTIGFADEKPPARSRRSLDEVVDWRVD